MRPIDWPELGEENYSEKLRKVEDKYRDEGIWPPHSEYPHTYERIAEELIPRIGETELEEVKILDVGASKGEGVKNLKENLIREREIGGIHTTSLDPNPVILRENRRRENSDSYVTGVGQNLPFSEDAFEITTCIEVLSHIPKNEREEILDEIYRVTDYFVGIGEDYGWEVRPAER